jgi:hypothetical protein
MSGVLIDKILDGLRRLNNDWVVRQVEAEIACDEEDHFGLGARHRDVNPLLLKEKTFLPLDKVWVSEPKGDENKLPLATLKSFDGINRIINEVSRHSLWFKRSLQEGNHSGSLGAVRRDNANRIRPERLFVKGRVASACLLNL